MTNSTTKTTTRIPRCEANWIAVVRLAPVTMPIATDAAAAAAVTQPLPIIR